MRLIDSPRPKIVITDALEIVMRCCGPVVYYAGNIAQRYLDLVPRV